MDPREELFLDITRRRFFGATVGGLAVLAAGIAVAFAAIGSASGSVAATTTVRSSLDVA